MMMLYSKLAQISSIPWMIDTV